MTNHLIGAAIGLIWGAVVAFLNSQINKRAIAKNNTRAIMTANIIRTVIDICALALVYLLRNVLPGSFEGLIVGTAISLGMLTVVFAFLLSRPAKKTPSEKTPTETDEQQ